MGYLSDVEITVIDPNLTELLVAFHLEHSEVGTLLTDPQPAGCHADIHDGMIEIRFEEVRWYSVRLMGEWIAPGEAMSNVEAAEALVRFAQRWAAGENGARCRGVFLRIGEDEDDREEFSWGWRTSPALTG